MNGPVLFGFFLIGLLAALVVGGRDNDGDPHA